MSPERANLFSPSHGFDSRSVRPGLGADRIEPVGQLLQSFREQVPM
jgi:hypothetical protein